MWALAPSHVIVNIDENTREMVDAIAEFVPNIIVTHPLGPRDNLPLYRLVGGVFGREGDAEALCRSFEAAYARLAETAVALPPRDVLYLIWKGPWMTVSRETYVSRMLALVNWRTVGHDPAARYPEVEITEALLAGTDIVFFSSEPYAFAEADIEEFRARYRVGDTTLAFIDGAMTSWYGARAIPALDYLRELAAELA